MNRFLRFFISSTAIVIMMSCTQQAMAYDVQTDSVSIYLDSARINSATAPLRAIDFANRAITLSIQKNNPTQEGNAYLTLATIQQGMNQSEPAIGSYKKSIQAFKRSSSANDQLFKAYRQLIGMLESLTRYGEAKTQLSNARLESFSLNDQDIKNELERMSIRIDSRTGESISESLKRLNALLGSERSSGNKKGEAETLQTMGDIYQWRGDSTNAEEYYRQAKEISDRSGLNDISIRSNNSLAMIYRSRMNLDEEIQLRNDNIALNAMSNNYQAIQQQNLEIGNAYMNSNNYAEAAPFLERAIEFSPSNSVEIFAPEQERPTLLPLQYRSAQLRQGSEAYRKLAEGYFKNNDLEKAMLNFKRYTQLQDSLTSVHEKELEEAIRLSTSIGKNEQRIELLEQERTLTDKSIQVLEQDRLLKGEQLFNRNLAIGVLGFFIVFMVGAALYLLRNTRARRKADKLLALQSLSGQMNPHFIFNALNSVNEYISLNDERSANRYLAEFSKLMRRVMDDSRHTFIPLQEEIEMLRLYLQLEHARFKDHFSYQLQVADNLQNSDFEIPPMIIQPFLENAIWHGLRYKEDKGHLDIRIETRNENLYILIADNGIGIQKSKELKTKNQKKQNSLGMKNIETRVQLLNEIYGSGILISVFEAHPGDAFPGTAVEIEIPQRSAATDNP